MSSSEDHHRRWTGAGAIGPGAEDRDQIADIGARKLGLVGKPVQRGAKAADDRRSLFGRCAEFRGDGSRIVTADNCAEIARGRELVVQSAVGDEEDLAMAFLPVDDPGQIDPRFPDQPATQLDRKVGVGEDRAERCTGTGTRSAARRRTSRLRDGAPSRRRCRMAPRAG